MQVQAHEIVKLFGIDALAKFASFANAEEIAQCKEDWKEANATTRELYSFNDGNNAFEVVLCFATRKAYRTDYDTDVTQEYIDQVGDALIRRVELRVMFGLI
jgi:hypothetical protein